MVCMPISAKVGKTRPPRLFDYRIRIVNNILDNVHGLIGLTPVEDVIERLPVFKRLHDIAQLGLVSRIFPCALHTRYTHSLGVLFVADKMATQLGLDDDERQLLRLAAMLHDIGHYPLSHDVEQAYQDQKRAVKYSEDQAIPKALFQIEGLAEEKRTFEYALSGHGEESYHHESIGARVIRNSKGIRSAIQNHFVTISKRIAGKEAVLWNRRLLQKGMFDVNRITEDLIEDICAIITGNAQYVSELFPDKITLFVQLIHSELDADNIDYLMRDATFSGTTYGMLDMGLLIQSLRKTRVTFCFENPRDWEDPKAEHTYRTETHYIVGVSPKGIGCAEQFLLNRYLAYNQVIHHKYTSILGLMLRHAMAWFLSDTSSGYLYRDIFDLAEMKGDDQRFLLFTDNYVINLINHVPLDGTNCPELTRRIIRELRRFKVLPLEDDREEICVNTSLKQIRNYLVKSSTYREMKGDRKKPMDEMNAFTYCFEWQALTKQMPMEAYEAYLDRSGVEGAHGSPSRSLCYLDRLMNGIAVIEDGHSEAVPQLLVDSPRSILRSIYNLKCCILRKYMFSDESGGTIM